MADSNILQLFNAAVAHHNGTPLAVDLGYFHDGSAYTLRQAELAAAYMPQAGHFLDIGTGSCIVPRVLKKLGYRVSTVDSPDASELVALDIARSLGIETISAHVGRDRIPLPDGSVDLIGAFDVIEHIPDSPRPFLAELHRVLRPGGHVIIGTPNAVRLTTRLKVALGYSNWPTVAGYIDEERNWGHHHEYTRRELHETLEACGYNVVAEEMMEARLGRVRISKMSDLHSQLRTGVQKQRMSMMTAATAALRLFTAIMPSLRSEMLVVATPAK